MVDLPGGSEPPDEGAGAGRQPTTGMPRWVKVSLLIVAGLVLLFVILKLAGVDGGHGPGRHMGARDSAGRVADGAVKFPVTANNLKFDPDHITVAASADVAIVLTSVDVLHDFVIDELGAHVAARKGETVTGGFRTGSPGLYTFYCAEPGHRQDGMEGTLLVSADAPSDGGSGGHRPPAGGHG